MNDGGIPKDAGPFHPTKKSGLFSGNAKLSDPATQAFSQKETQQTPAVTRVQVGGQEVDHNAPTQPEWIVAGPTDITTKIPVVQGNDPFKTQPASQSEEAQKPENKPVVDTALTQPTADSEDK